MQSPYNIVNINDQLITYYQKINILMKKVLYTNHIY